MRYYTPGIAKEMKGFLCVCGCFGTAIILMAWTNYVPELCKLYTEQLTTMNPCWLCQLHDSI